MAKSPFWWLEIYSRRPKRFRRLQAHHGSFWRRTEITVSKVMGDPIIPWFDLVFVNPKFRYKSWFFMTWMINGGYPWWIGNLGGGIVSHEKSEHFDTGRSSTQTSCDVLREIHCWIFWSQSGKIWGKPPWLVVSNMNFIFHNIWDNPSHWLICFRMVKTTNQYLIF